MIANLFKGDNLQKGVHGSRRTDLKILSSSLYITVKYGVSLSAVAENIIDKVKYTIEKRNGP